MNEAKKISEQLIQPQLTASYVAPDSIPEEQLSDEEKRLLDMMADIVVDSLFET